MCREDERPEKQIISKEKGGVSEVCSRKETDLTGVGVKRTNSRLVGRLESSLQEGVPSESLVLMLESKNGRILISAQLCLSGVKCYETEN